jgi:deoxyuridine 5'-triphosphate nucleotidohydrolase
MTNSYKFALREDLKDNKEFLPSRATPDATGWDVRCAQEDRKSIIIRPGHYIKIPLGIRVISPKNWWLELKPRSSTFAKKALHCLYGTIDTDYRGSIVLAAQFIPDIRSMGNDLILEFGEAVGQLVPVELKHMEVEEVSNQQFDDICKSEDNKRGASGFGSTSK